MLCRKFELHDSDQIKFFMNFKFALKFDKMPWIIAQGILSKNGYRVFSIFKTVSEIHTCSYNVVWKA